MKAIIFGNGPSLRTYDFETLPKTEFLYGVKHEIRTYGVNRIWKLWENNQDFLWRPTDYVIGEMPSYSEEHVKENLFKIAQVGSIRMHIQRGFCGFENLIVRNYCPFSYYETCKGIEPHKWHLPLVCGYGTVVNIAVQIAVLDGAEEIELIGCDLGHSHFYGDEFMGDKLALKAHKIAAKNIKIPVKAHGLLEKVYA
jgi:hypothetical protein